MNAAAYSPISGLLKFYFFVFILAFLISKGFAVDPMPTSGLGLWLRATNGTVVRGGTTNFVTSWDSFGGPVLSATASGTSRPTWKADGGPNGNGGAIRFGAASPNNPNSWLNSTVNLGDAPNDNLWIFLVAKDDDTASVQRILTMGDGTSTGWQLKFGTGNDHLVYEHEGAASVAADTGSGGVGGWCIYEVARSGTDVRIGRNGRFYTRASAGNMTIPSGGLKIGRGTSSQFMKGQIAEILIYETILSASHRQLVYENLEDRYGAGINADNNPAPTATLSFSPSSTNRKQPNPLVITVAPQDDGFVQSVKLLKSGSSMGTKTGPPYVWTVDWPANGTHSFEAQITDDFGAVGTVTDSVSYTNNDPVITAGPVIYPNPVKFRTATLVLNGSDPDFVPNVYDANTELFRYAWKSFSSGITLTPSGTNHIGRSASVVFSSAGTFSFEGKVIDPAGASVADTVSTTVVSTAYSGEISPSFSILPPNTQQTFASSFTDQFGAAISAPSDLVWSAQGPGSMTGNVLTTGATQGVVLVSAQNPNLSLTAYVGVNAPYPTDTNTSGLSDETDEAANFDPQDSDSDDDGLSNTYEKVIGTSPYRKDTDRDGVEDASDAFPLDPSRSSYQGSSSGLPVVTLDSPAGAVLQ